jgi:hypothetical protein
MTREQIEQMALEYSIRNDLWKIDDAYTETTIADAFLAGAGFRQAEIDALSAMIDRSEDHHYAFTADIERYKADVIEGLERERVARKVIEDKRGEVEELADALAYLYDKTSAWRWIPSHEKLNEIRAILKKYGK